MSQFDASLDNHVLPKRKTRLRDEDEEEDIIEEEPTPTPSIEQHELEESSTPQDYDPTTTSSPSLEQAQDHEQTHRRRKKSGYATLQQQQQQSEYKPIETKEWQSNFSHFPIVDHSKDKKKLSEFYEKQNQQVEDYAQLYHETINKAFLKDEALLQQQNKEEDGSAAEEEQQKQKEQHDELKRMAWMETFCIQASFWCNVLLLCLKVMASIMSLSLSVVTSTIDSVLDLISGLILFYTNQLKKKNDIYRYPVGKERLEPLGFVIFATCMASASFQIIKEGVLDIVKGVVTGDVYLPENNQNVIEMFYKPELMHGEMEWLFGVKIPAQFKLVFYMVGLGVLFVAIVLKSILYMLCSRQKSSPSCQAYAFDHRNDVMANSFLIISLFVSNWVWWFDPLGATLLSIYIIYGWIGESAEHVTKLVGVAAESEFIKKLTFIAVNHNEKIDKVETVQAWYSGTNIIAEIHIVLPPNMSLREAHNIGEDLQLKIESVPEVEQCFVHLDFNSTHKIYK